MANNDQLNPAVTWWFGIFFVFLLAFVITFMADGIETPFIVVSIIFGCFLVISLVLLLIFGRNEPKRGTKGRTGRKPREF